MLGGPAGRGFRAGSPGPGQGRHAHAGEQALHRAPLRSLTPGRAFAFCPAGADPATTVYVDGTESGFRSLSHWPGNATPPSLRDDLSTGIALRFARLSPADQHALLGDFSVVANNHYDTDGALSAFAILQPEQALPRSDAMLGAAAAGDFSTWHVPAALAVELTVQNLTHHPASPLAAQLSPGLPDSRRWALGYDWLLANLPAVLDDPFAFRPLWAEEHARVVADVARIEAGTGVSVRRFPDEDLALVSSDRPITSVGLHLAAGDCTRVLLVRASRGGFRYRFLHRVESWFDLASRRPPPRAPLQPAVDALNRDEPPGAGRWWCSDVANPVAALGCGAPVLDRSALFGDPDLEADAESRLPPSAVLDALRASFRIPPA